MKTIRSKSHLQNRKISNGNSIKLEEKIEEEEGRKSTKEHIKEKQYTVA